MIIPSIDIAGGETVQLVGGKEQALSAGAPAPWADRFGRVGEVAVIDLDAALSRGSNADQIQSLLNRAPCRVGGGIRDVDQAIRWLDAGARKVIIGTAANPEFVRQLPKARVIAALDAVHQDGAGQVVDQGWTHQTGQRVTDRLVALRDHVDGFLITFVEREGQLTGIDLPTVREYVAAAGSARVTIAGGVASSADIAALDQLGADAQVGMALYTDRISLAEGFCAPLTSDRPDGLWPTVVVDEAEHAMGICYSNLESVERSLQTGEAHYWSRRRGLWKKGESSGATQQLLAIDTDCDRDALRFKVMQTGRGFCHLSQTSCFGDLSGLPELERRLHHRRRSAPAGSYSRKLFESPELLAAKLREEADELTTAVTRDEIIHEAADVVFFALARLVKEEIPWNEVAKELDRRSLKVTRRSQQESQS